MEYKRKEVYFSYLSGLINAFDKVEKYIPYFEKIASNDPKYAFEKLLKRYYEGIYEKCVLNISNTKSEEVIEIFKTIGFPHKAQLLINTNKYLTEKNKKSMIQK